MKLNNFKELAKDLLGQLTELVETNMVNNGDTSFECQRMYLLNTINEVDKVINGIEQIDLKEDDSF